MSSKSQFSTNIVYSGGNGGNIIPAASSSSSASSSAYFENRTPHQQQQQQQQQQQRRNTDDAVYPPGSMSYINLNINEYRIQDLEDFFTLPTKNYDIQEIVHKKKTMCAAVDKDYTLTPDIRANIYGFLDQALARLVQHLSPITTGKPVTNLPVNTLTGDNGHFLIDNPARDGVLHYDSSSKTGINLIIILQKARIFRLICRPRWSGRLVCVLRRLRFR